MRAVFLIAIALAVANAAMDYKSFKLWTKKHNKSYSTPLEESHRYGVWRDNVVKIAKMNAQSRNATYALNKFSDLTSEEFKELYLMKNWKKSPAAELALPAQKNLPRGPSSFDWRDKGVITAVKDQGQCGSCWAFATTEEIESVCMISKGTTAPSFAALAPQQIVDCDTSDNGCNGGDPPSAYQYVISAQGQDTEQSYPYQAQQGQCNFQQSNVECTISSYQNAGSDENSMADALSSHAPLAICIDASQWQSYSGGVVTSDQCGSSIDHAVQCVGYDQSANPPYWIVRNSWGESWGENGFIRLEFGTNTCGITTEATYPVA